MVHYTCDLCGRRIPHHATRYRVSIEVEPLSASLDDDFFLDDDPDGGGDERFVGEEFVYDLCEDCAKSYLHNPLRVHANRFRLSDN